MADTPDPLPQDINFDIDSVRWCWDHINDLMEGHWPAARPSNYHELNVYVQRGVMRAPFEMACLVAAEVRLRAAKCGTDSYLVEAHFIWGKHERDIAAERHLPYDDVCRRIAKVLWYSASGRNQRIESYDEWKRMSNRQRIGKLEAKV